MNEKFSLIVTRTKKFLKNIASQPKKKLAIWAGLAVLVLGASIGAIYYSSQQKETRSIAKLAEVPACDLPKVDFKKSAFSIGVPQGWIHEVDNGTVAIMEDESNTTAAFLYTARLQKDLSAGQFLTEFADVFKTTVTDAGGQFALGKINDKDGTATALTDATVEEGKLTGKFQVDKDDDFVTLKVYWAPVDKIKEKEPVLKDVVGCFARHKVLNDEALAAAKTGNQEEISTELKTHTGQYFKLLMPSDFKVTGETDSGIDTSRSDNKAGFSFAYVTGARGPYTPQSWAESSLSQADIRDAQMSGATDVPSQMEGYAVQQFDFSGKLAGTTQVQGRITVGVYNTPDFGFGQSSSAFTALQLAVPSVWPKISAVLQEMQNSIEITDIGSRKDVVLPPNRPIESTGSSSITSSYEYKNSVSDRANENWSEAMRGYEPARSPSTGTTYDVPLNAWNPSGPDGPGYYRSLPGGGVEKLDQQ